MKREDRLERLPGCLEPLFSQVVEEPWYDREQDAPEHLELRHENIKAHVSKELGVGNTLTVYIQPPGKEVGGRDCAPIEATYEVVKKPGTSGELIGRFNLVKVRSYMVSSRKYRAEVLSGDTVELWPTSQADHFVMGLLKEVCWACGRETGDAANGLAYICDGCDKAVHARCAGLKRNLREDEEFFCRRCRPTVAADEIGEEEENAEEGGKDVAEAEAAEGREGQGEASEGPVSAEAGAAAALQEEAVEAEGEAGLNGGKEKNKNKKDKEKKGGGSAGKRKAGKGGGGKGGGEVAADVKEKKRGKKGPAEAAPKAK